MDRCRQRLRRKMDRLKRRAGREGRCRADLPAALLLILILLAQAGMMVHFGLQKQGFHEDEMATFELANLPGGFLHLRDGFLNSWQPGDFFAYPLTVDAERAFDYSIPYHNQEVDVHPPLYYYVIHTASSLVPGTFSKWVGIVPNILLCMLAAALLFRISRKISGSRALGLITAAAWALSVGAMTTAVFIRMYALLTVCCLLLVLVHLRAYQEAGDTGRLRWPTLLTLLACTAFGILTQYYFLVFCFFLCGCFFLYLAASRRWGALLRYAAAEVGAIAVSVAYFPSMLYHIFSGYRGEQAMENALSGDGYLSHVRTVASIISRGLFNGWIFELLLILALLLLIRCVGRLCRPSGSGGGAEAFLDWRREGLPLAALGLTACGYILVIARVAPYQVDRYYLCVYPLIVLLMVHGAFAAGKGFLKKRGVLLGLLAVLFLGVTALSYQRQTVNYLYPEFAEREEALSAYEGAKVICLNGDFAWAPDRWLTEYRQYDEVYRCGLWDFTGLAGARETGDLSGGFLLYAVWPDTTTEDRLFEVIGEYYPVMTHELVTSVGCRVYYVTLEDA